MLALRAYIPLHLRVTVTVMCHVSLLIFLRASLTSTAKIESFQLCVLSIGALARTVDKLPLEAVHVLLLYKYMLGISIPNLKWTVQRSIRARQLGRSCQDVVWCHVFAAAGAPPVGCNTGVGTNDKDRKDPAYLLAAMHTRMFRHQTQAINKSSAGMMQCTAYACMKCLHTCWYSSQQLC